MEMPPVPDGGRGGGDSGPPRRPQDDPGSLPAPANGAVTAGNVRVGRLPDAILGHRRHVRASSRASAHPYDDRHAVMKRDTEHDIGSGRERNTAPGGAAACAAYAALSASLDDGFCVAGDVRLDANGRCTAFRYLDANAAYAALTGRAPGAGGPCRPDRTSRPLRRSPARPRGCTRRPAPPVRG